MNDEMTMRVVDLLEQINEKLEKLQELETLKDRLDAMDEKLYDLKLEVCGFQHEGNNFPGAAERVVVAVSSMEDALSTFRSALPVFPPKPEAAQK